MDNESESKLPPFAVSFEQSKSWSKCYKDEQEYIAQCQRLISPEKNQITVDTTEYTIEVDYIASKFTIATKGDDSGAPECVSSEFLRYCFIEPKRPREDNESFTLVVSYWVETYATKVQNLLCNSESAQETREVILLMNALRQLVFLKEQDPALLLTFSPYITGIVGVYTSTDLSMNINDIQTVLFEPRYIVLDEEGIFLYDSTSIDRQPNYIIRFLRDSRDDSIEKIFAHPLTNQVEIETSTRKFVFTKVEESTDDIFAKFSFYVQGRIAPKHAKIFDFKEPDAFYQFMTLHPREEFEMTKPKYVKVKSQPQQLPATTTRDFEIDEFNDVLEISRNAESSQAQEVGIDFEMLVTKLRSCSDSIAGVSEEAQLRWFQIEAHLNDILNDGLVPESSIKSGGLDANTFSHFEKTIDEIQEAIFTDKLDYALSHTAGLKEIFKQSRYPSVTTWLNEAEDIEIIKQIYIAASKG